MRISHPVVRLLVLGVALAGFSKAGLILDRGLPNSTNVNNVAGANRSNVSWISGFSAGAYYLVGDSFSFGNSGTVDSITVFEVANNTVGSMVSSFPTDEFSSITLYYGNAANPLSLFSSTYTSAPVAYQAGLQNYQGFSGNFYPIYSLTFSGLNLAVTAGTTYDFAVDAAPKAGACATAPSGDPCTLALHASNAALSGTPQQGSDNQFIFFTLAGSVATFNGFCDSGSTNTLATNYCGAPWDKSSDINVQIQGTLTPEPATWGTLAASLAGLIVLARKRRK